MKTSKPERRKLREENANGNFSTNGYSERAIAVKASELLQEKFECILEKVDRLKDDVDTHVGETLGPFK